MLTFFLFRKVSYNFDTKICQCEKDKEVTKEAVRLTIYLCQKAVNILLNLFTPASMELLPVVLAKGVQI
jgi:hypothetical protein